MKRSESKAKSLLGLAAITMMVCGSALAADPGAAPDPRLPVLPTMTQKLGFSSGAVENKGTGLDPKVVWAKEVTVAGATSLRLKFSDVQLAGGEDRSTTAYVRITNLTEKAVQFLDARSMKDWGNKSAYFNGDRVLVELLAKPGTGQSTLTIEEVYAGTGPAGGVASQCGPTEDRVATTDARVGRMVTSPTGSLICTAWLIDDANHMLLSAGHCAVLASDIIEFNCPPSTAGGAIVHPGPEDQYPVDGPSRQTVNTGIGNDYSYFGCNPNSNTGLTPYQAQADFFTLITPPAPANQDTRVTGYGTHPTGTLNGALHTDDGPYMFKAGNEVGYQVDTDNGDSGSPVFLDGTQNAFAIHTNAGCTNPVGVSHNSGTAINNAGLQAALASPLGICQPVNVSDPTGPLYFVGDITFDSVGVINRETGVYGAIGPSLAPNNQTFVDQWEGLAYDRVNNVMYCTIEAGGTFRLDTVNLETGQILFIGLTNDSGGTNINIEGLAFDPNSNTLYGYAQTTDLLYKINTATGAMTTVGAAQPTFAIGGIDYDPEHDILYGVDDAPAGNSRLVKINTTTGAVTAVGTDVGVTATDLDSLAYSPDDGYCYTVDQGTQSLIRIDPATGKGVVIGAVAQTVFDGGMASVAGDCSRPIQPAAVTPPHGATGVSVNLPALVWDSADSEYCGSTGVPGSITTAGINTPFRGHFFEVFTAHTMTEIKADLSFAGNKSITWACYEFEEGGGTGQLIYANTQTEAGVGARKQYTSGKISIPMKANHWYAAGWHYGAGNDVTFFRDQPIPPGNTGAYGLFQGGAATNAFGAALPATAAFTGMNSIQTTRYAMEYCFDPRCYNPAPDADQAFNAAPIIRGNVLRMDQSQTLTEFQADLNFVGAQTVNFVIYEAGDADKTGDLILNKAVNLTGTGRKMYSSGAISVPLKADRVYGIGVYMPNNTISYHLKASVLPVDFQYGTVLEALQPASGVGVPGSMTLSGNTSGYGINMCFGPHADTYNAGDINTDTGSVVANVYRGMVFNVEKDTVLDRVWARANLPTGQQIGFFVYDAPNATAPATLLYYKAFSYGGAGEAWYTSPELNIPLVKGRVYAIGYHKPGADSTYFFENNPDFTKPYDFGTVLGGMGGSAATLPNNLASITTFSTTYTSRMFFSCETWYNVSFGDTTPPPLTGRTVPASADLSAYLPLDYSTKYYWRIEAHNCCGVRNSDGPFEFTTESKCYPDCDGDGALTIDDFICFQTFFALGDKYADCDGDTVLTIDDFICFQTFFAIGC